MNVTTDPRTKKITADGFCLEVFKASIGPFNYDLEFILWTGGPNYDNLALALSTQVLTFAQFIITNIFSSM